MFDIALFFGESHTGAIRKALGPDTKARHRVLNVCHIEYPLKEEVFFNPLFRQFLEGPTGARPLYVSMLGGNAHNILGLVRRGKPFDFTLPEEPGLEEEAGAEPQTYAFIDSTLRSLMSHDQRFLRTAQSAIDGSLVHIESPPPVEDEALIRDSIDLRLASGADLIGISSPLLRYKLWRLQSRIVAETCLDLGIEYIPVPTESLVGGRFLRPELFQDATHANGAYGELILSQIEERFSC